MTLYIEARKKGVTPAAYYMRAAKAPRPKFFQRSNFMKNRRSQKTRNFDPVEYIVELLRENPLPEGTYSKPGAKFPVYAKAVREIVEQAGGIRKQV